MQPARVALDPVKGAHLRRQDDDHVTTLLDLSRTFDRAGNVSTASTTLASGTDNQAFCYDEQNRLTWAGSQGTPPCTGSAITAGTLSGATYTQSFAYDVLGRLTYGPQGTYSYGDGAHLHAATAIGSGYTASYDAAGDMTCRAPTSASTCAGGTATGAQLGYDSEGELATWQNAPSSPNATATFFYDGQGQRVAQQSTQAGSTTTTVYVGDLEEVSTTGGTTTTTAYYYAGGKRIGLSVNGTISYLTSDALGSATETLNGSGNATASQLYAPYGTVRYSSGTMPTAYGFTGQRLDAVSGLDYYGARYYDPVAGQFTSADSVLPGAGFDLWGLSRYAYVAGNPVGRTDPSGHMDDSGGGCGSDCDPGPPPDPCEGSSNCGDPCAGECGGPEPGPPPDPGPPPNAGPPPDPCEGYSSCGAPCAGDCGGPEPGPGPCCDGPPPAPAPPPPTHPQPPDLHGPCQIVPLACQPQPGLEEPQENRPIVRPVCEIEMCSAAAALADDWSSGANATVNGHDALLMALALAAGLTFAELLNESLKRRALWEDEVWGTQQWNKLRREFSAKDKWLMDIYRGTDMELPGGPGSGGKPPWGKIGLAALIGGVVGVGIYYATRPGE
jgi:RHS repeat-associated protein